MIRGFGCLGVEHGAGVSVTSLQLPPSSAPHMGEVAHSEVRSMSNVSDSAETHRECQFSRLTKANPQAPSLCMRVAQEPPLASLLLLQARERSEKPDFLRLPGPCPPEQHSLQLSPYSPFQGSEAALVG